jgi:hypothetical protein
MWFPISYSMQQHARHWPRPILIANIQSVSIILCLLVMKDCSQKKGRGIMPLLKMYKSLSEEIRSMSYNFCGSGRKC